MDNLTFLKVIKESFLTCLNTSERSTAKLKVLHGAIAKDIYDRLNLVSNDYSIMSQGFGKGKEYKITGRYINNKAVDITIISKKTGKPMAGVAVKFVMSNYSQNSNNYFENMLGETANIRSANIPYFQIFIIPDIVPYYKKDGTLTKWENINEHHLSKYIKLAEDNADIYMHVPNKTLVFIIHIDEIKQSILFSKQDYKSYFTNNEFSIELSNLTFNFKNNIIYNDYEKFAQHIQDTILNPPR